MNPVTPTPTTDYVYDIKIKFEPFYLCFHLDQEVVKLPRLFNEQHLHDIADKVYLCDPAGNMFQLAVEKRYSEAYFTQGWTQIGIFYGLQQGGWVRMVFIADDMIFIQLRNRLDLPVIYPIPAKMHRLGQPPVIQEYPRPDPVPSHFMTVCQKPALFHILEKTLTHGDIASGFLHIPIGFCEVAFRQTGLQIVIYDEYGHNATCTVEFDKATPLYCGIAEGWNRFAVDRAYFEGLRVQLCVPCASPTILCVSVSHKFL